MRQPNEARTKFGRRLTELHSRTLTKSRLLTILNELEAGWQLQRASYQRIIQRRGEEHAQALAALRDENEALQRKLCRQGSELRALRRRTKSRRRTHRQRRPKRRR